MKKHSPQVLVKSMVHLSLVTLLSTCPVGGGSVGDGGSKFNVGDIVHFQETDGSQYEITAIVDDALDN